MVYFSCRLFQHGNSFLMRRPKRLDHPASVLEMTPQNIEITADSGSNKRHKTYFRPSLTTWLSAEKCSPGELGDKKHPQSADHCPRNCAVLRRSNRADFSFRRCATTFSTSLLAREEFVSSAIQVRKKSGHKIARDHPWSATICREPIKPFDVI
jgi:hypothetical protein